MRSVLDNLFKALSSNFPETSFEVEFWDGAKEKYGLGPQKFKLILKTQKSINRIIREGSIGFGEEFMKGNIQIEGDIQELLKMRYDKNYTDFLKFSFKNKLKIFCSYVSSLDTIIESRKNIKHHYDIGNDFYSLWLDSTLTYSCGYFKNKNDTLKDAQLNKYEHISKKLQLKEGDTLIDIGCGWGGMMFYAAENYGIRCSGYTLSKQQYDYVVNKIQEKKLGHLLKVYFKDYRQAEGKFYKFVSIAMLEAVGKKFLPIFFNAVKRLLKPQGIGLIHTIGSAKDEISDPWLTKYIFPGGFIPTLPRIIDIMDKEGLTFFDIEDLRIHYPMTLNKWLENFNRNTDKIKSVMIKSLGSIDKVQQFIRMWKLYLNASSVAFKSGNNRLYQITFSNGLNNKLPLTRSYIY